jgi:CRISPR/Cas system-associated exonuclease Cas4 (RecB family)
MPPITKNIFLNTVFCSTLGWRLRNGVIRPEYSPAQLFRMEQGKKIHGIARGRYPDGIFVNAAGSSAAAARTRDLLANPDTNVLFEATFLASNYIAKADILIRDAGGWELIEVKSSINAKAELIDDMAYTTLVAQAAGFSPSSIHLMLIDKNYRLGMPDERLFVKTDVTEQVLARVEEFRTLVDQVDSLSSLPEEPEPRLTFRCKQCEYFDECLGEGIESPIFNIPRLRKTAIEQLIELGIISIHDVPESVSLSDNQRRVVECVRRGTMQVDPALRQKLARIRWPAYYLDFETMMTALPLWPGVAPYEHIPVQYSLHIRESPASDISHTEYLADPGRDCRRDLAERLIADLPGDGSIITYSSFEKTNISALGRFFPDLSAHLQSLTVRIVDLEPCIKCINHPKFCGRTSIKVVLPVLVPSLSYEGLEIGNGDDALVTFAKMAQGMMGADEMERKRAALLEYCKMDTLAMVRLHEVLEGMVGT